MTGVLPVDKPEGPTSHDVVASARRALRTRRIGHTGTLDPFATGLLLLCIGPATRLAEYLSGMPKTYEATARLGVSTDTLDRTGSTVATSGAWRDLSEDRIRRAFEAERGTRLQEPPAYSAKRIAGRRSYELAREGSAPRPDPVEVTIHRLDVTAVDGADVRFTLTCSSGTYVRAVARDAGERLGVGAHLTALRRTAVGPFQVDGAVPLDRLEENDTVAAALLSPLQALRHLPVVRLDTEAVARVRNGRPVPGGEGVEGSVAALAADDRLVAVAEVDGALLRPRKVFA